MEHSTTGRDARARLDGLRADLLDRMKRNIRFERREVVAIVVLVVLVVGGASLAYARGRPADAESLAPVERTASDDEQVAGPPPGQIVVHVVGAVRKPGVYDFGDGARVIDAIEAAGGFTKKAARESINLARPLVDGEQLVVPVRGAVQAQQGSAAAAGAGEAGSSKLNINLATAAEFETLPGIGPVLAERIIGYREQHGPFRSVQDLQKVSGIGPKIFESLEPVVTV